MKLRPVVFVQQGWGAASLGASTADRVRLWACQLAGSLRYVDARLVQHLTISPAIRLGTGRPLTTTVRFGADDWLAFHQVFVGRDYDWDLGNPTRVLDLGANCGFAALWFASRFPDAELAAVEPFPSNAQALRHNLERNDVRARVFEAAVAAETGRAFLQIAGLSTNHRLSVARPPATQPFVEVSTVSLPSLLDDLGWPRADLVKVDIEGSERMLFEGSPEWLSRVGRFVGELHGAYGRADLERDLGPRGFRCAIRERGPHHLFLAWRE